MALRLSKFCLALAVCTPVANAAHWSSYEGRFDCPDINNSHKCARHLESKLDANIVHRSDDDQLIISLDGGVLRPFKDSESIFVAVEHVREQHGLVIYEQHWEGGSYGLVDLGTGLYQPLLGYLLFSDDGKFFVATNADLDAEYSPNVLQIWRRVSDGFQLVFDAEPGKWGPLDVKWIDSRTISFAVGTYACAFLEEGPCKRGLLTGAGDDWSIQLPATVK